MSVTIKHHGNHIQYSRFLTIALILFLFQTGNALADIKNNEDDTLSLGRMVVTAEKREQSAEDIPGSVTVFNDIALEDAGISDMEGLSAHIPSLEFYNFGSRRHSLTYMRGIKSHGGEPAIGYYVDGVNYSKSAMFNFPLFDVERIEVLKGPQGTLYGRNTMGGVINIITKEPDNETDCKLSSTFGNYNLIQVSGYFRTPIIADKLFFGIAGTTSNRDGYMENDFSGAEGQEGRHEDAAAARMKLRYRPTDLLDMTLSFDSQRSDEGAFPYRRTSNNSFVKKGQLPEDSPYHYSHDFENSAETDFQGISLNADYKIGAGTLTSITGYRDYDCIEFIDTDFSPMDMMRMKYLLKEEAFSQEIRFANTDSNGPLKWLAGAYYFNLDDENDMTYIYRPAIARSSSNPFSPGTGRKLVDTEKSNEGTALFGQMTYTLISNFDITLGARYETEKAEMDMATFLTPDGGIATLAADSADSNDSEAFLPKVNLAWRISEHSMLYATVADAHRSSGFVPLAPAGKTSYDEEDSRLYEIGSKSTHFDNRVVVNLAVFYTDIDNEQVSQFDPVSSRSYLANSGESHRLGIESEIQYRPLPRLRLSAGFSLMEAEYDTYSSAGIDYAGNNVFGVPDYTFNLAGQYRRPLKENLDLFGRIEISGVGNRYFDDANTVKNSPYQLTNLKVGLEGRHFDYYLWINNLFDRHYLLFENTKKGYAEDGEPFEIGITLNYTL